MAKVKVRFGTVLGNEDFTMEYSVIL